MPRQIAIDESLFTWPSNEPRLLGSRCDACDIVTFPKQASCPRCNAGAMRTVQLPPIGTLWTYTTQEFRPKGPPEGGYLGEDTDATFVPYALGYVELPGYCKVESRLVGNQFKIGMHMELAVVPFRNDEHGNEIMMFAFRAMSE